LPDWQFLGQISENWSCSQVGWSQTLLHFFGFYAPKPFPR